MESKNIPLVSTIESYVKYFESRRWISDESKICPFLLNSIEIGVEHIIQFSIFLVFLFLLIASQAKIISSRLE